MKLRRLVLAVFAAVLFSQCISPAIGKEGDDGLFRRALADTTPLPAEEPLWRDGSPGEEQFTDADTTDNRDPQNYNRWMTRIQSPAISVHRPSSENTGTAVVICPGGAYAGLAIDKEGYDVARWFASLGVTGVVLKYRVNDYGHPAPRDDVKRALRTIRHRAKKLGVSPQRIGVMGFSAGGHLASTAGTHFDAGDPQAADPIDRESSRPDFMILVYPVISFRPEVGHPGSKHNLLGDNPDLTLIDEYSNETRVTAETPPTFVVHTIDDPVKVENSIVFFRALKQHNVPVTFAVFPTGGHGYGLGVNGGKVAKWPKRCEAWLRKRGMLDG
jgi:acetyl esterase/lipase